jgi:hypothetical protein
MFARRRIEVPCTVEIEQTPESLHAHVVLDGAAAEPGDEVLVQGAPSRIPFGKTVTVECRATILRAGPLRRLKARLEGYLELTELFEVSFSPGRTT